MESSRLAVVERERAAGQLKGACGRPSGPRHVDLSDRWLVQRPLAVVIPLATLRAHLDCAVI